MARPYPRRRQEIMTRRYIRDPGDFLDLYRNTCDWFSNVGFEWAITRYGAYEKHFSDFERFAESRDKSSINTDVKHAFDNAYPETNEIIRVHADSQYID